MSNNANAKKALLLALFLLITIAAPTVDCFAAAPIDIPRIKTEAFLYFRPNPVGVNQEILVNAWTSPQPLYNYTLTGVIPPGGSMTTATHRYNYYVTFTKPDNTTYTVGPMESDGPGTIWFTYKPDQVGTWTVQFSWEGERILHGLFPRKTRTNRAKGPRIFMAAAQLPNDH
jgi:hypothetical protein